MIGVRRFRWSVSVLAFATVLTIFTRDGRADEIRWPQDVLFDRNVVDADVREVLNRIVGQTKYHINYRTGVQGTISFNFQNMPLGAAFNEIIDTTGLEYQYDSGTQTITILPATGHAQELVPLAHASPKMVQDAARRLGIGGDMKADDQSGILLLHGSPDQVKRLQELAKTLDENERKRLEAMSNKLIGDASRGTEEAKRLEAEAKRRSAELEVDRQQRLKDEILGTDTKIIALKYASVGKMTQTFQGQTVAIPGIDETLRAMLGISESKREGLAPKSADEQRELADLRKEFGRVPPVISIDERTNSIIVRGTPSAIAEVERAIQKLDKPVELVEIEVMIVAAQEGVAEELGVRWGGGHVSSTSQDASAIGAVTAYSNNGVPIPTDSLTPPSRSLALPGAPPSFSSSGSGGGSSSGGGTGLAVLNPMTLLPTALGGTIASYVYRGTDFALQAQINALSQANKLQTISAPRIITLNNLEAKITNDRTNYLPTPPGPNAAGTLQEVKAGLILRIMPSLIHPGESGERNLIRLNINASDKDVQTVDGRFALSGNEVQTQVVIPDGATFVMGGLMHDQRREGKEGIPLLEDIPLLGALFSTRASSQDLQETIFFITPRVVRPNDVYAQDIAQRTYLQNQRAKLGDLRRNIQNESQLLRLHPGNLEEDE